MATTDESVSALANTDSEALHESAIVRQMAALADQISRDDADAISATRDIASYLQLLSQAWPQSVRLTDTDALDSAPGLPSNSDVPPELPLAGERFEIRRMLGQGGFGVVLLAFDKRLAREVALKIPRPEILVSRDIRHRFLREAQAAAALDHPNIVPVFDTGDMGPIWFITSRYVPGPTLAEWLREQESQLARKQAAELVAILAEAMQHAHARGVLHRDLKPANVLLEPTGDPTDSRLPFAPRLSDFGLARRLDEDRPFTRQEALVGTPRYMAPEQAACRHNDVGIHTDVYGLGVILYELLTGNPPHTGESDVETLHRIMEEVAPVAPLQQQRVPRDLQTICLKCLQKKPCYRYQTAGALAADLRRFLNGEPIAARPVSRAERLISWCRRRPAQAAFLSVLIGATLITSTLVNKYWKQRTLTANNFALAQQAIEQDALTRFKAEMDLRARSVADSPGDPEKRYLLGLAQIRFAKAIESETERDKNASAASRPRITADRQYLNNDAIREAFHNAFNTLATLTSEFPKITKFRREIAAAQFEYCIWLYRCRDFSNARSVYTQAYANLQQLIAETPKESYYRQSLAESETALSDILGQLGERNESLEHCYSALESWSELRAAFPHNTQYLDKIGESRAALSRMLLSTANVDLAKRFYGLHVNHWTKLSARSPHSKYEVGRSHGYFGDLLFKLGDVDAALQQAESELSIWTELRAEYPANDEYEGQISGAHSRLKNALIANGDLKTARDCYERIIAGWVEVGAGSSNAPHCDSELARSYHYYGDALRRHGESKNALEYFGKAIAINTVLVRKFPKDRRYQAGLAWGATDLGILARQAGDIAEAQRYYTQTADIYYRLCADFPDQSIYRSLFENTANTLAWSLATSDNEEFRDGNRALQLANDVCYSNGYKEARFLDTLAAAHAEVGDFDSAVKWSTRAIELLDGQEGDQWREPFSQARELYKVRKPMRAKPEPAR